MTQGELSERSGVSRSYIAQVERGDVTNIGVEPLMALAKALDVSVAYLVGETDVATKEDEDELTLAESRNVYSVDPATRELLELIEGMDGSQHDVLLDEIEKRAERLLSQRADIQRRRLELAEQAGRAVRLADVAAAGPGILQDDDVRAVNTWLWRHVRLYVANNHITLVEWL